MGRSGIVLGSTAVLLAGAIPVVGHPAGRLFAEEGASIAAFTRASHRAIAAMGVVDDAAPAAAAILLGSVIVAASVGMLLLVPAGATSEEETSPRVPAAALLGHGGGVAAALLGYGGAAFYGTTAILAAAILLPGSRGSGSTAPLRSTRVLPLLLLGALLVFASGGADGALQAATGARPLPEAWFTLASESGGGWLRLPVLGLVAAIAAAAYGMESVAERSGLLVATAAWALLLGPSSPCRALALAGALHALARAGLPPAGRAAFAVATVAGTAALVFA